MPFDHTDAKDTEISPPLWLTISIQTPFGATETSHRFALYGTAAAALSQWWSDTEVSPSAALTLMTFSEKLMQLAGRPTDVR